MSEFAVRGLQFAAEKPCFYSCEPRTANCLLRREALSEPLPAAPVVALQRRRFERELRRTDDETRLEHERERVAEVAGLERRGRGCLAGGGVRAVRGHAVVQTRAAGHEPFRL